MTDIKINHDETPVLAPSDHEPLIGEWEGDRAVFHNIPYSGTPEEIVLWVWYEEHGAHPLPVTFDGVWTTGDTFTVFVHRKALGTMTLVSRP